MKPIILLVVFLGLFSGMYAATAFAETNVFAITDDTLPVELSSFSAVQSATNFVALSWTTQSETALLGYQVYRSEHPEIAMALRISATMIPATNTSSTQIYSFEDREVQLSHSYYYWLESVEYNHSNFHGPISITLNGDENPILPVQTTMQGIYPNPFKAGTIANIEVQVKENEAATIGIYNVAGQKVKSYSINSGNHLLNWDGKDSRGKACSSGIYLLKLASGSINQSAKLMYIK